MAGPIRPEEVTRVLIIPEVVFDIFNTCIAEKWDGSTAVVQQEELVKRITNALGCDRSSVFDKHYLDIETDYRQAGWEVEYDKPGFNETYSPRFIFRKPEKKR